MNLTTGTTAFMLFVVCFAVMSYVLDDEPASGSSWHWGILVPFFCIYIYEQIRSYMDIGKSAVVATSSVISPPEMSATAAPAQSALQAPKAVALQAAAAKQSAKAAAVGRTPRAKSQSKAGLRESYLESDDSGEDEVSPATPRPPGSPSTPGQVWYNSASFCFCFNF